ncbi:hypothetical protein HDU99_007003, partial [Rhizoclosmatium hyalinum]
MHQPARVDQQPHTSHQTVTVKTAGNQSSAISQDSILPKDAYITRTLAELNEEIQKHESEKRELSDILMDMADGTLDAAQEAKKKEMQEKRRQLATAIQEIKDVIAE